MRKYEKPQISVNNGGTANTRLFQAKTFCKFLFIPVTYLVDFDSLIPKIPLSPSKDLILGSLPSLEVSLIFTVFVTFYNNVKWTKMQN